MVFKRVLSSLNMFGVLLKGQNFNIKNLKIFRNVTVDLRMRTRNLLKDINHFRKNIVILKIADMILSWLTK